MVQFVMFCQFSSFLFDQYWIEIVENDEGLLQDTFFSRPFWELYF